MEKKSVKFAFSIILVLLKGQLTFPHGYTANDPFLLLSLTEHKKNGKREFDVFMKPNKLLAF